MAASTGPGRWPLRPPGGCCRGPRGVLGLPRKGSAGLHVDRQL